jgi:predicted aspartyl protease
LRGAAPAAQGPSAGSPRPLSPEELLFACPTTLDHVGRVIAAVRIDGKGPFRFIVDTGANHSTISPRLAITLGLKPSAHQLIEVAGVTGTAKEDSVFIAKLQAGDLVIADSRFPVIRAPVMAGAEGILGAAGLSRDRLLVNFQHDQVFITRSHTEALPWGFTRMWATRLHGGLLSVPGRVGNVRVRAIIDTGSQRTLGNLALYRQLFAEEQGKGKYVSAHVYGATRQVGIGKLQLAPSIDLGAIKIGDVGLVFGNFHIFRAWGLTARPTIILGMDVLGTVKAFVIDFRYGEIGIDTSYNYYESANASPPHCLGRVHRREACCHG